MKYFKVFLGTGEELYIKTAKGMDAIALWVLRTRKMDDYYGMCMQEVTSDKKIKLGGDLYLGAIQDYYRRCFNTQDDEVVRQELIKHYTKAA